DFSLLGLWQQMGLVARGVVILLIAMSMYALGIGLERFITYRRGRARSIAFIAALEPLLRSREKLDQAARLGKSWQDAPLARIVDTGLREYQAGLQELGGVAHDAVERELLVASVGRSMDRAKKRELAGLSRGLPALATISSSAPFVGLFGTVFGIITAFRQMADPTEGGGGGLATVSAGIAEALMTTAVGLAVAIVAVWLFNFFTTRVNDLGVLMDDATGELSDRLLHAARGGAIRVQGETSAVAAAAESDPTAGAAPATVESVEATKQPISES
ncbi:MAG TPA: MotA/TolQ/ExbB proton channel family protein, partial [Polyangiaceae bacterium]|nr:MotA/TolQ/ExbB proton channel family protein [Polyangiaceae bacterium]